MGGVDDGGGCLWGGFGGGGCVLVWGGGFSVFPFFEKMMCIYIDLLQEKLSWPSLNPSLLYIQL